MSNKITKFKHGDILYCSGSGGNNSCNCIVQVLSRRSASLTPLEHAGYNVHPLSPDGCKIIHNNCCAGAAIKVTPTFVKYFYLFREKLK